MSCLNSSGRPVAIDLFCGCGGLTLGMRKAGINVLAGIDNDRDFKETYEINNRGSVYVRKDIREVTGDEIRKLFRGHEGPRILAGCAPCQPFSSMNWGKSKLHRDYSLLLEFGRLIGEVKPDGIIMENVPQLAVRGKKVFDQFLMSIHQAGLIETYDVGVDFAAYGVPQHRRRLVLIAARKRPSLPRKTHGPNKRYEFNTVRNAIAKYPPIESGHTDYGRRNHSCKSVSGLNLRRLSLTPHDGGSRRDIPISLWVETHKKHTGHEDTYGRMRWNGPAPTLTSKCTSITNGRFAHPEQDRGISVREAATLQTFPDRYSFPKGIQNAQRCIGNAVPPLTGRKLSIALLRAISED